MITTIHHKRSSLTYRILSAFISFTFVLSVIMPPRPIYAQAAPQSILNLPIPGSMVPLTPGFNPPLVKGITLHPDNPLKFDFIIDQGDSQLSDELKHKEYQRLIKYFLASLTVPEKDLWVNLSPHEGDRIIPNEFGLTEMGRDLLAQDYILKQLTASLIYPEDDLGKKFWDKIYKKARTRYGDTEIPVSTFNKVWIAPQKAVVFEQGNTAYVAESRLKVMLEADYVAMDFQQKSTATSRPPAGEAGASARDEAMNQSSAISRQLSEKKLTAESRKLRADVQTLNTEIIREVIIPAIEKEVNEGKNFAQLRQIYNSLILAAWYKQNLKESLLVQIYADKNKISGINTEDKTIKQKIYDQYMRAFKQGVYDYIKEDYDPVTQEIIPRKYFSGGAGLQVTGHLDSTDDFGALSFTAQEGLSATSRSPVDITEVDLREAPAAASPVEGNANIRASERAGIEIQFPDPAKVGISKSPQWSIAGFQMQHVQIAPNTQLNLSEYHGQGKVMVKVITGYLENIRRNAFDHPDVHPYVEDTRSTYVRESVEFIETGAEGAVIAIVVETEDVPDTISEMTQAQLTGELGELLNWAQFGDAYDLEAFKDLEFYNLPAFQIKGHDGREIAYIQLWSADKCVNCGDHDHTGDRGFGEVHLGLFNGTGRGGMVDVADKGNKQYIALQRGFEHKAFWRVDVQTGYPLKRDDGSVVYDTHRWEAGQGDVDAGHAFDIWLVYEIHPDFVRAKRRASSLVSKQAARKSSSPVEPQNVVASRRANIALSNNVLDPTKPYEGYDVIIISSTSEDERRIQEEAFDATFGQRTTESGRKVMVLSVLEEWEAGGAGNFLGSLHAYEQAVAMARQRYDVDLDRMWNDGEVKITVVHNGGNGKRASPLPTAENNSRGQINMVGQIDTENGAVPMTLLLSVAIENSIFAQSNDARDIDIFWASQMFFGTRSMAEAQPTNQMFTKFVQRIEGDTPLTKEMIQDLGMFELDVDGNVVRFVAQNSFESVEEAKAWLSSIGGTGGAAFDLGSHRIKRELFKAAQGHFEGNLDRRDAKLDLDPDFTQPLVALFEGIRDMGGIGERTTRNEILADMDAKYRDRLTSFRTHEEIIDFYLANRELTENIDQWVGAFSIGTQIEWWRYRRPLEILNGRLLMIADVIGSQLEVAQDGSAIAKELTEAITVEAQDLRQFRGIEGPIVNSVIGGRRVQAGDYTFEQVRNGVTINGVYVRGSMIVNSELARGSTVVNSVVNETRGRVRVTNGSTEHVRATNLTLTNGLAYNVVESKPITIKGQTAVDVFREAIDDEQYAGGQTRLFVDHNVDGKVSDGTILPGNSYSFEQLRDMPNRPTENNAIKESAAQDVFTLVNVRVNVTETDQRTFSILVPRLSDLSTDERTELRYEITQEIYNRMIFVGPRSISIEGNFEAHSDVRDLFEEVVSILTDKDNAFKGDEVLYERSYYLPQMLTRIHRITTSNPNYEFTIDLTETGSELAEEAAVDQNSGDVSAQAELGELKKLEGVYLGIDVGGSDIKVVAIRDGIQNKLFEQEFGEEVGWRPETFTTAEQYIEVMRHAIHEAMEQVPDGEAIQGIGISWPDMIIDGVIVGGETGKTANLGATSTAESAARENQWNREEWSQEQYWAEFNKLGRLAEIMETEFEVPVAIANDGNVTAFWAAVELEQGDVLGIALGTSPAAGYVDKNGHLTPMFLRASNVAITRDQDPTVFNNNSGILDVAQKHLAQAATFRLAQQAGIALTSESKAGQLNELALITASERDDYSADAVEIFRHLGEHLAITLDTIYHDFGSTFPDTLLLTGRITRLEIEDKSTGTVHQVQSGTVFFGGLQAAIAERFPHLADLQIIFPEQVVDDSNLRRFAQAYGAIYLVNQKIQGGTAAASSPVSAASSPLEVEKFIVNETSVPSADKEYLLTAFKELDAAGKLTSEIAKFIARKASSEFVAMFEEFDTDVLPDLATGVTEFSDHQVVARTLVEVLARIGMHDDYSISKVSSRFIFKEIVEHLNDYLQIEARDIFGRFIYLLITVAQEEQYEVLSEFRETMAEFGLDSEKALAEYHKAVREATSFKEHKPRDQVEKIVVLPRITIGAETAINGTMIQRALDIFPNAIVHFIADKKLKAMFEGNPRVKIETRAKVETKPQVALARRLVPWLPVLKQIREIDPDYVFSADSRTDSQGLFPMIEAERYFYWENTVPRGETMRSMAILVNERMDQVFGPGEHSVPTLYFTEAVSAFAEGVRDNLRTQRRHAIAVKYDVGGEYTKSLGQGFNREHLSALLADDTAVIMDRGFNDEELKNSDELIAMAREQGAVVIEVTDLKDGRGLQVSELNARQIEDGKPALIVFHGTMGGWVSLTAIADQAFSYDSVNQHVATADKVMHDQDVQQGIPTVIAFTGYHSEVFPLAWSPTGHNHIESVTSGMGKVDDYQPILRRVLAAHESIKQASASSPISTEQLRRKLPLEFAGVIPSTEEIPNWPAIEEAEQSGISAATAALINVPYYANSMFSNVGGGEVGILYALSYVRSLTRTDRAAVLGELDHLGYADLAQGLEKNHNKHLPEQLTYMSNAFQTTGSAAEVTAFVERRDKAVVYARGLRIGIETSDVDNSGILARISGNQPLLQVTLGLRSSVVINDLSEINQLREAFWALRQVEGMIVNVVELGDGRVVVYNEYEFKKAAMLAGDTFGITTQGLEHLIKKDMAGGEGTYYDIIGEEFNGEFQALESMAGGVLTTRADEPFGVWHEAIVKDTQAKDVHESYYRGQDIARQVFELRRPALDVEFIGTGSRVTALKNALIAELEAQKLFNQRVPIVVIDGTKEPLAQENRDNIAGLIEQYDAEIVYMSYELFKEDVQEYVDHLIALYRRQLSEGTLPKIIEEILTDRGVLVDGVIDEEKMYKYVRGNAFKHISGLRNYTVLMGAGDENVMNFDDDAPIETYVVKSEQRDEIRAERQAQMEEHRAAMYAAAGKILGKTIDTEVDFYQALAVNEGNPRLEALEAQYFAYTPDEPTGLIPQVAGEIQKMEDQYLDQDGLGHQLKLTHQRYQALMGPFSDFMVRVSDFHYQRPRFEKKDHAFHTMPVNVFGPTRLIGQTLDTTDLSYMERDLRGTMAHPVTDLDAIHAFQEQRIVYIPYPFVLDQDGGGLAQFIRYLENANKQRTNLQHADQGALLVEGIGGFAGNVNVIFNRSAFDNRIPTPTIGRDLRLEEPPYIIWISKPMRRGEVTVAYSKVSGGQQREIGERLYTISKQDFTEVAGGLSRAIYEEAVGRFNEELAQGGELAKEENHMLRLIELGRKYMEVAEEFGLDAEQRSALLREQEIRAMLAAELGIQRSEKEDALDESANRAGDEQQIIDMSLIQLQFASSFHLYRPKNFKANDFGPQDQKNDYLYEITIEGDTVKWQAVIPDITVEERRRIKVATAVEWIPLEGQSGEVSLERWKAAEALGIEQGRSIILNRLPKEGQKVIVPAVVTQYSEVFLEEVEAKVRDQVKSDGELLVLWPDILDGAKNWRNYPPQPLTASSPVSRAEGIVVSSPVKLTVPETETLEMAKKILDGFDITGGEYGTLFLRESKFFGSGRPFVAISKEDYRGKGGADNLIIFTKNKKIIVKRGSMWLIGREFDLTGYDLIPSRPISYAIGPTAKTVLEKSIDQVAEGDAEILRVVREYLGSKREATSDAQRKTERKSKGIEEAFEVVRDEIGIDIWSSDSLEDNFWFFGASTMLTKKTILVVHARRSLDKLPLVFIREGDDLVAFEGKVVQVGGGDFEAPIMSLALKPFRTEVFRKDIDRLTKQDIRAVVEEYMGEVSLHTEGDAASSPVTPVVADILENSLVIDPKTNLATSGQITMRREDGNEWIYSQESNGVRIFVDEVERAFYQDSEQSKVRIELTTEQITEGKPYYDILLLRGLIEQHLNRVDMDKDTLLIVRGGMVHAIRGDTTLVEFSIAPSKKHEGVRGLKDATTAFSDSQDGKQPRPKKEQLEQSVAIFNAVDGSWNQTNVRDPSAGVASQRQSLSDDGQGNRIDQLFGPEAQVVVEEMTVTTQLSDDTRGHGTSAFVLEGTVDVVTSDGQVVDTLRKNDNIIIPAYLGEYTLVSTSKTPAKIWRWYAPIDETDSFIPQNKPDGLPPIIHIQTTNIRTGKDGYTWGRLAKNSKILATLDKMVSDLSVPEDEPVAELWLGSDDRQYRSKVQLDGSIDYLDDLLGKHGEAILGRAHVEQYGNYLGSIMKIIDTREALSSQLHSEGLLKFKGRQLPPKPEMWMPFAGYGGSVYLGWSQDMTEERLGQLFLDVRVNVGFHEAAPAASSPVNEVSRDTVGGIDFTPGGLNLQIKRDGNGVPLPVNLQPMEFIEIDGFLPVIINITPVTSLPLLSSIIDDDPIQKSSQKDDYHPGPLAYLDEQLLNIN